MSEARKQGTKSSPGVSSTRIEAGYRIQKSLDCLSHTQRVLMVAASEIGAIKGVREEHRRINELFDQIRKTSQRLEMKLAVGEFDLDQLASAQFKQVELQHTARLLGEQVSA